MKRKIKDTRPAVIKGRSGVAMAAIYRSGAGVHADQRGKYKRHSKHKARMSSD